MTGFVGLRSATETLGRDRLADGVQWHAGIKDRRTAGGGDRRAGDGRRAGDARRAVERRQSVLLRYARRVLLQTLLWGMCLPLAGLAAARFVRLDWLAPIILGNALTPWIYLPLLPAGVLAWRLHSRAALVLVTVVGLAAVLWTAPLLVGSRTAFPDAAGGSSTTVTTPLRLLTANVMVDNADREEMAEALRAPDADILVFQEFALRHAEALTRAEFDQDYPHRMMDLRSDPFGSAVYSKVPLVDVETVDIAGLPLTRVRLGAPFSNVTVYNVHTRAPMRWDYQSVWAAQLRILSDLLHRERAAGRAVIAAGDWNATLQHRQFTDLLGPGPRGTSFRDAHRLTGRAYAGTWPTSHEVVPPLLLLDHVVVSDQITVTTITEGTVPGSDHRSLLADLLVFS